MAKILLVEDDLMIGDILLRRFRQEGYEVVTATDGARAVMMARAEQPALIVMDMGLPVMNGWQATYRIRNSPETRAIPIIALTAYAMTDERQRCLAVGCDDFEPKPVDFGRLFMKVRALVAKCFQVDVAASGGPGRACPP